MNDVYFGLSNYYTTAYFWITLIVSVILAIIAVHLNDRDERNGRL